MTGGALGHTEESELPEQSLISLMPRLVTSMRLREKWTDDVHGECEHLDVAMPEAIDLKSESHLLPLQLGWDAGFL